jgi:hypothetical protein
MGIRRGRTAFRDVAGAGIDRAGTGKVVEEWLIISL